MKRPFATFLVVLAGLALLAVMCHGCAARKQKISATPVVIIPRECITKVELTPDSECYADKEGNLTLCRHITIVRAHNCEVLKANP